MGFDRYGCGDHTRILTCDLTLLGAVDIFFWLCRPNKLRSLIVDCLLMADVLSCAVAKNDLDSIGLLINKYPDLMSRTHPLWSKPLIQVRILSEVPFAYFYG